MLALPLVAGLGPSGPLTPAADAAAPAPLRDRVVVVVSIDGLTREALVRLGPAGTPTLHRMRREGASTLNARSAYEQTVTLPNHTGMLTGRRVDGRRGHRLTVNDDPGGTLEQRAGRYRASFFDVVHDHGGTTELYASKEKFALFDRSWNASNGAPDTTGADDGRDKIDRFVVERPALLVDAVVRRLATRPADATFVHLASPDRVGHDHGFMSPRYLDAVRRSDALVGEILAALDVEGLRQRADLVVTADHGGAPGAHGHDDPALRANHTIPFLVWGADAAPGANLYDLNPGRTRPGPGRPAYDAPPVRNTDVAALVTTLLGAPPNPGMLLPGTAPLRVRRDP